MLKRIFFFKMAIYISDPTQFRQNIAHALYDSIFQENAGTMSTAEIVEESIYQFAVNACTSVYKIPPVWKNPSFVNLYTSRFRSLFHNLKHEPAFLKQVVDGTITKSRLTSIQHIEMAEQKWAPYIQQMLEREKYTQNQTCETTDMFVCPQCSSQRSTYYSLQTRGGDEPMTIFIRCVECEHNWTE